MKPSEIEQLLYESTQLFPTTPESVEAEMRRQQQEGPCPIPEGLRDADAVLKRIIGKEETKREGE